MSLLAATISTFVAFGQLFPDPWPSHGYFQVTSERGSQGETICQLQGSARIGGDVFALILRGPSEEQLEGVFMSPLEEISGVERVGVTIDGEEALWFPRAYSHKGRDLTSVVGLLAATERGQGVFGNLREKVAKATWFGVTTAVSADQIPAAGLLEAVDDFQYCLQPLIP
jgi:hypothetical protein